MDFLNYKGAEILPQTLIFYPLLFCKPMPETFDTEITSNFEILTEY